MKRSPAALLTVVGAVGRRPSLWLTAVRQLRLLTPRGWWRRRPFRPGPSGAYLQFRMLTQYGRSDASPTAEDVVNYLRWCRQMGSFRQ